MDWTDDRIGDFGTHGPRSGRATESRNDQTAYGKIRKSLRCCETTWMIFVPRAGNDIVRCVRIRLAAFGVVSRRRI